MLPEMATKEGVDQIKIGGISCDFIKKEDFYRRLKAWLKTKTFHHVVTLNPEMVMTARRRPDFMKALQTADWRVPDGAGIVWARWYLRSKYWSLVPSLLAFSRQKVERITGVALIDRLAKICDEAGRGIYLVGGQPAVTAVVREKLQRRHPSLPVAVYAHVTYQPQGPAELLADIQAKKPAVLLVAFGAPNQTLWLEAMRHRLSGVVIGVGVGGAFDIISERLSRAPQFLRQSNLEWLWRLYLEPKRLPRVWQAVVRFPWLICRQKREKVWR